MCAIWRNSVLCIAGHCLCPIQCNSDPCSVFVYKQCAQMYHALYWYTSGCTSVLFSVKSVLQCAVQCTSVQCSALIRMICSWFGGCARGLSSPLGHFSNLASPVQGQLSNISYISMIFLQFFFKDFLQFCNYLWQSSAQGDYLPLWTTFRTLPAQFRPNFRTFRTFQ